MEWPAHLPLVWGGGVSVCARLGSLIWPNELDSINSLNWPKGLASILILGPTSYWFSKFQKSFVCSILNIIISEDVFFNFISISFSILSSYSFFIAK